MPTKHTRIPKQKRFDKIDDPNMLRDPQTPEDRAALAVTCLFLGKTFHENDTICYRGGVWRCGAEGWEKTGSHC
jgi:hypothetical protein